MIRTFGRWILGLAVLLAAVSLVAYAADWTVFRLRGSPQSTVAVSAYMEVPLKGGKTEYDYLGTLNVPCAVALFPHGGKDPCWNLRRNPNQWVNAGGSFILISWLRGHLWTRRA
jgi:hypothetical protein